MSELVIGADGFIGGRLRTLLGPEAEGTSRRNPTLHPFHHLDLLDFDEAKLPAVSDMDRAPDMGSGTVYICAGVNGALECFRRAQEAYRVNVDATIRIAQHYTRKGAFVVWISSTTAEWSTEHYGRQKALAETALRVLPFTGIVRAGRVLANNVDDLCATLARVGRERIAGVTLWGIDEQPYAK